MGMEERTIRLDLEQLQQILRKAEVIKKEEYLNDVHVEPGELVLRVLK